jgi:hypothetical protein
VVRYGDYTERRAEERALQALYHDMFEQGGGARGCVGILYNCNNTESSDIGGFIANTDFLGEELKRISVEESGLPRQWHCPSGRGYGNVWKIGVGQWLGVLDYGLPAMLSHVTINVLIDVQTNGRC